MACYIQEGRIKKMHDVKTERNGRRHIAKYALFMMMAIIFAVSLSGCGKNKNTVTESTAVPATPEECITGENMLVYYYEAVVATVGGDGHSSYSLYKYTDNELVLVWRDGSPDKDETMVYRIVPATVYDDCLKLAKKYRFGKGKWVDGDCIVGMEFRISIVKDGEIISVSSESMPDNGEEAFYAFEKALSKAWSQA